MADTAVRAGVREGRGEHFVLLISSEEVRDKICPDPQLNLKYTAD